MHGTIAKMETEKGFGFIQDEAGERRFFHASRVVGGSPAFLKLRPGMRVEFEPAHLEGKGLRAVEVKRAE